MPPRSRHSRHTVFRLSPARVAPRSKSRSKRCSNKCEKPVVFSLTADSSYWTPDSGATISATNEFHLFKTVEQVNPEKYVTVANGSRVRVEAIGTIACKVYDDQKRPHVV